jgi:integrase
MEIAKGHKTALEYSSQTGDWIDPRLQATPYVDWAEEWIATKTHLKPKTLEGYESLFKSRILPEFGSVKLRDMRAINIEQWIAAMHNDGLSASRIKQAHSLLASTLSAAVRSQMLRNNPATGVSLPRAQRNEMPFLTPGEVRRLADALKPPDRTLIYTLAYTGIRQGEATALRRSNVNLLRREIIINESATDVHGRKVFGETKNRQTRIVALPGFLVPILEIHLEQVPVEPDALVFTSSTNGPIDWSNFRARTWKPALAVAGIDPRLRMHDLRHTAASILIAQGCHPKVVQEQLGHGSIVITMDRYGHLYPGDRSKVSDALDAAFASGEEATA